MAHPIVYINSWPGVGKYTIAKEVEKQMEGKACAIRNQLHIDLAGAILPRTSTDYLGLRRELRSTIFKTLVTCADTFNHIYIFTDFQTTNKEGVSVATEYSAAAKERGCAFITIVLECQMAENEQRMRSPERLRLVEEGQCMLVDTGVLSVYRGRGEIYKFQCPEQLILDVTDMSYAKAAEIVVRHVNSMTAADMGPGKKQLQR